jgi:hypothetical protein
MEQHAIPQQISSYQFRLVGDMTLKQFFQLAGGVLFSLLFYASPLHPLIKWPFILFFTLLGVALAFLPFEERPLDKWIIAFFRSIYSPTIFKWQKAKVPYAFFQQETAPQVPATTTKPEAAFAPFPTGTGIFSKLEEAEKSFLSSVGQLFSGPSIPSPISATTQPAPTTEKKIFEVPRTGPVAVTPQGLSPKIVTEEKPVAPPPPPEGKLSSVSPTVEVRTTAGGQAAQFSIEAAPPNPPTQPNTIVGQIFDTQGKIIEGAILEIRDAAGRPVRALKSNMLGHFIIVTPLSEGRYEIVIEKEGFTFDPITFEAKGEIIPPIAISAKGQQKAVMTEELSSTTQAQL